MLALPKWTLDPDHSTISFAVKHMAGLSTIRGQFRLLSGAVETDQTGCPTRVEATMDAASIDTGNPQRDGHLRSADFLSVDEHPTITFAGNRLVPSGDGRYAVEGDLTVRGVTRPVRFEARVTGPVRDPWGNLRVGASASGALNRKDWGVHWNQVLEAGGLLVGEEVRFDIEVEAVAAEQEAAVTGGAAGPPRA